MSEHNFNDVPVDNLVINRMTRAVYDDLLLSNRINQDELYLIDDENFDVFDKRVINVNDPQQANDAVNLGYLSSKYINYHNITDYVDNSRVYSSRLSGQWPDGQTYIQGDGCIYEKDISQWTVTVISGSVAASDVTVTKTSTFGWQFHVGSVYFGQNFSTYPDTLHDSTTYEGETLEVSATSWHKCDTLVRSSEIANCLSGLTDTSELADVRTALLNLKQRMSA